MSTETDSIRNHYVKFGHIWISSIEPAVYYGKSEM